MKETISLTIPMTQTALSNAIKMFQGLLDDTRADVTKPVVLHSTKPVEDVPVIEQTFTPSYEEPTQIVKLEDCKMTEDEMKALEADELAGELAEELAIHNGHLETVDTSTGEVEVVLDSVGMAWDSRIHASSHAKLAKNGRWKLIRGVDKDLVIRVEAALSGGAVNVEDFGAIAEPAPTEAGAVFAPTTAPVAAAPAPAPVAAAAPAPAAAPVAPAPVAAVAPAPVASALPSTFPGLMQRITAEKISQADITKAVNSVGVAALPLLPAQADKIPQVAAILFGGK